MFEAEKKTRVIRLKIHSLTLTICKILLITQEKIAEESQSLYLIVMRKTNSDENTHIHIFVIALF